ncbi:MAG: VanZ family protein [Azonexaceae bacterium]|nr:VanZ family protein [Azonexaceae bacterium]
MTTKQPWVRSWFWLIVGLLAVSALFVLGAQPFAVGIVPSPFDKVAHALAFGSLFLVLDSALVLPLWLALMIPLLVSAGDEFHQIFLPGRQPGLDDWLAGSCGVVLAASWRHFRR